MSNTDNRDSCHNPDSEIIFESWCRRRLLVGRLHRFFRLGVEKCHSASRNLHPVAARIFPGLGCYGVFQTVHVVELQLGDLVVCWFASGSAEDLMDCVLPQARHLFGDWDVIIPVLSVEKFRVCGFAEQDDDLCGHMLSSRSWLRWSRSS